MAFLRLGVKQFADTLAWLHKNGISQQESMCCLHVISAAPRHAMLALYPSGPSGMPTSW